MYDNFYFGILNGGKSQRIGSPKSMIIFNDLPLIEYIYNILFDINKNIIILGKSQKPDSLNHIISLDDTSLQGPISALVSAYNFKKSDWFFIATDMFKINKNMILEILELKEKFEFGVIPYHDEINKYEPFFGYYKKELLSLIIQNINEENYSLQRILSNLKIEGNSEFAKKYQTNLKSLNNLNDLKESIFLN
ncbi:MAG TPA: NTP transferase domain-containing protein [Spirochaetota bacterium]|nr:NTP transferase domain-containing protein [Spirochaetota bacterium]